MYYFSPSLFHHSMKCLLCRLTTYMVFIIIMVEYFIIIIITGRKIFLFTLMFWWRISSLFSAHCLNQLPEKLLSLSKRKMACRPPPPWWVIELFLEGLVLLQFIQFYCEPLWKAVWMIDSRAAGWWVLFWSKGECNYCTKTAVEREPD